MSTSPLGRQQLRAALFLSCLVVGLLAARSPQWAAAQEAPARGWLNLGAGDLPFGPPTAIGFTSGGEALLGSRGGYVLRSVDGGRGSWALPQTEAFVTAVAPLPDGTIWLALDSSSASSPGVLVLNPQGRPTDARVADGLVDDHVRDLVWSATGEAWAATAGGLGRRSRSGAWGALTSTPDGLLDDDLYSLALDVAGDLWVGSATGLSRVSADGHWTRYLPGGGLAAAPVRDLAFDGAGVLWCATDAGLSALLPDDTWRTLTTADGIPSSGIAAVAPDRRGGVWAATSGGLIYLSPESIGPLVLEAHANLPDTQLRTVAVDSSGQPWVATGAGVSVLIGASNASPPTPAQQETRLVPTTPEGSTPSPDLSAAAITPSPFADSLLADSPLFERLWALPEAARYGIVACLFLWILGAGILARRMYVATRPRPASMSEARVGRAPASLPPTLRVSPRRPEPTRASMPTDPLVTAPKVAAASPERTPVASPTPVGAGVNVDTLLQEGRRLARAGRKAEAYDLFSAATRLRPHLVEAWIWKGGMALHPREAVRCLERAVQMEPENRRAREGLAWAQERLRRYEVGPEPDETN
jgi:hypothetical protein